MAHERLFRLGTAGNLTVFALDVILIIALYVVLMPVNRSVALLATGWGLIETAILVVVTLTDFDVLRILSGADYLPAFEAGQRGQALVFLRQRRHSTIVRGASGARSSFLAGKVTAPQLVARSSIPRSSWVGFLYRARIPR